MCSKILHFSNISLLKLMLVMKGSKLTFKIFLKWISYTFPDLKIFFSLFLYIVIFQDNLLCQSIILNLSTRLFQVFGMLLLEKHLNIHIFSYYQNVGLFQIVIYARTFLDFCAQIFHNFIDFYV